MNSNPPADRKPSAFNVRRFVMTLALMAIVGGIGAIVITGGMRNAGGPAATSASGTTSEAAATTASAEKTASAAPAAQVGAQAPAAKNAAVQPAAEAVPAPAPNEPAWTARAPGGASEQAAPLGSSDPKAARFTLTMNPRGAGIDEISFSDLWRTAKQAADARAGSPQADGHYALVPPGTLQGFKVPLLAARVIDVDGRQVVVSGAVWKETAPGAFVTEIVDGTGSVQLRATRTWKVDAGSYDIRCEQRVENLSGTAHTVRWVQFGPTDLTRDPNDSVDSRRFQAGYLMSPERDPAQQTVIVHGATLDHGKLVSQVAGGNFAVWPNESQKAEKYGLAWFGATNRYFSLAVHAPYAPPAVTGKAIAPAVADIQAQAGEAPSAGATEQVIFTTCSSEAVVVQPKASAAFDVGVFAGPLERSLLGTAQPFAALNMQGLILYMMGGCCSFCTFSWLAEFMVWFLGFLHDYVVFDWALAIIMLVIAVRTVLHPLTRRAQISMQRVTKQMATIKPEVDALQKRYKDDPKKLQEETMRLYRERGVNPLGCAGGMLPTFLQTPIWIALYAVLYFAFELRQQPAFFGVFQRINGWGFLGDLSAQDRFIPLPFEANLYIAKVSSINLIPILMGIVFFVQQKYMTPPPTVNQTPEQEQQQKMMKWMMVFLFPVMLYQAPSGLTLYIATSTLVGIIESKRIREEVKKMDFSKQGAKSGWLQAAYANAMKRAADAQKNAQSKAGAPAKKYRDR